ncbi:MAG: hypothetical protein MUE67_05015 [Anaerolineales bacterium]|nr:hypothetical protein [Anaerolineales bacterium]
MIWLPLLLTDPSPCLRWLVLRHLFGYPEAHPEVQELSGLRASDPLATALFAIQEPDGSWKSSGLAEGSLGGSRVLATAFALTRLGYLGFDRHHPVLENGAAFLFSQQRPDGSWPLPMDVDLDEGDSPAGQDTTALVPLQTALPLRGLAAVGYAQDPRSERAYEWLLQQRLPDGAWPTGIAWGVYRGVAGYRRLAHSRWGCRSNTTAALLCLALHPQRQSSAEARRALDLLLGRETHEEATLGYEVARLVGAEPPRGFLTFFARHDLALILSLSSQVGVPADDERFTSLLDFIHSQQGPYGLWEYPARPQVTRWVTFDILRSLSGLDQAGTWISQEPRTPFQPYPKRQKRF